jgi:outer membrane protein assembly factor BamB
VNLADGKEARRVEIDAYVASSVAVDEKGSVFFGHYGNEVVGIDPNKGAIRWKYRDRNFPYFASVCLPDGLVIAGGRDKRLHAIDREKGDSRWQFPTRGAIDSSPIVCKDSVVFASMDGRLYCVALADGSERWVYEIGAPVTASLAAADGILIVAAEDGNVFAFKPKSTPQTTPSR